MSRASGDLSRTRQRLNIIELSLDGPERLVIWSEANEFVHDSPPPHLTQLMRDSLQWSGIATDWIVVNHHRRVQTDHEFEQYWTYANLMLGRNGIRLIPGVKIHDFIPGKISPKAIVQAFKTGSWARELVEYGDLLYEKYGISELATDWETFGKEASRISIPGDTFSTIREAFESTVDRPWQFVHWFPGLLTVRFDYLEAARTPSWVGARNRFNIARNVFVTPLSTLLTGDHYWARKTWSRTTETRYDLQDEKRRSLDSLNITKVMPGITCSGETTFRRTTKVLRYLQPREILEMPIWQTSQSIFFFVKGGQFVLSGRAMRAALNANSAK